MFSVVPTTRNSSTTHRSRRTTREKWTVTWFWLCAVACLTVVVVRSRRILNSLVLYSRGKLLEHFILIVVALFLNILLSWAFVTSLNCSVMCKPKWWFECYFRRSSWIHCWLLLAVLSDYFGQLVTSTFLLCKFWGLPGSTPVSFPFMRRWKCLGMNRLSQPRSLRGRRKKGRERGSLQPSSTSPGKRPEKLAEAKADLKRVTKNPGRVCFILNQKR